MHGFSTSSLVPIIIHSVVPLVRAKAYIINVGLGGKWCVGALAVIVFADGFDVTIHIIVNECGSVDCSPRKQI